MQIGIQKMIIWHKLNHPEVGESPWHSPYVYKII